MKITVALVLFAAAMSSVFFVAGLANVPRRVRVSVASIGPAFLLMLLLYLRWPVHTDWGLGAIGAALSVSALVGFHYTNTTPMSRDDKFILAKRFGIIFAIAAVTVAIVTALIVRINKPKHDRASPQTTMEYTRLFIDESA